MNTVHQIGSWKFLTKLARLVAALLIVTGNVMPLGLATASPIRGGPRLESAALSTVPALIADKADYAPGEVVHITGSGFAPDTAYAIPVMRPDGSMVVIDPVTHVATPGWDTVTADADGNLAYDYQLNGIEGQYEARAYPASWSGDWNETPLASVGFTDAQRRQFTQCRNDSNNDESVDNCDWSGGAINATNSIYTEGDSVPQRLFQELETAGAHTIRLEYEFSQGDIYAYDFLTTVNLTMPNGSTGLNECADRPSWLNLATCTSMFSGAASAAIPSDPFDQVASRENPASRNFLAGCSPACSGAVTISFPGLDGGDDPGEAHVSDSDPDCFQNCGNTSVQIDVTFTTSANDSVVGLWFGGHLAEAADPQGPAIGWGTGCGGNDCGASSISGAPFHLKYIRLDNTAVGQQDNPINIGGVVAPGIITIIKDAVPDDPQDFAFTNASLGNFSLDDDPGDGTLSNTTTFTSLTPGAYSVSETVPPGWDLTGLACDTTISGGDTTSTNLGTATASIDVDPGESITCTFTNTKRGHIVVNKVTDPASDPQVFSFDASGGSYADFSLSDGQSNDQELAPGDYSVTESALPGWDLTSADCDDDDSADPAALTLDPGETIHCTFTNTKHQPAIAIAKSADVSSASHGDTVTYTYEVTNPGNVLLSGISVADDTCPPVIAVDVDNDTFNDGDADEDNLLDPGETWLFTCIYVVGAHTDGEEDPLVNEATASGTDPESNIITSEPDTASVNILHDEGALTLVKDGPATAFHGDSVTYTYTVTYASPDGSPAINVAISDDKCLSVTFTGGDTDGDNRLDVGETWTFECATTIGAHADGEDDPLVNTATVTGKDLDGDPVTGDQDDHSLDILHDEGTLNIEKTADPTEALPGTQITYTYVVTYTSPDNSPATNVMVTDDTCSSVTFISGDTDGDNRLDVSETWTFECTATLAEDTTNTATVTGEDMDGDSVTGNQDTAFVDALPTVNIVKSADLPSLPEPGGVFTFTLTITNTSPEPVTITSLIDTQSGVTDFSDCAALVGAVLDPGESVSCTYTVTHTVIGAYDNTAEVTVADDEGNTASASDDETVAVADVPSSIEVVKTADPAELPEPGGSVTFNVHIENTSLTDSVEITSLIDSVHGNLDGEGTCGVPQTLTVGGVYDCSFTVSISGDPGDTETDEVTASGTDDDGEPVSGEGSATVTITDVPSSISVTKTPDPDTIDEPGADVVYTIVVENTSAVDDVTITSVVDDQFGDISDGCLPALPATLAPGESVECIVSEFIEGNADDEHTNEATAFGADDDNNDVWASGDATVAILDVLPEIDVDKVADPTSVPETGGTVSYIISVANNSVEDVTLTSLEDDIYGDLDGLGDCDAQAVIALGETYTCTFSVFVSGNAGESVTDFVTATAIDDELNTATDDDDATVGFADVPPTITVEKVADPISVDEPGGWVDFTVTVHNTSGEPVMLTVLEDDLHGDLNGQGDCALPQTLGVDDSYTCTFSAFVAGDAFETETDIVTATANDDELNDVSASGEATVTVDDVLPTITVEKTASPEEVDEPGDTVNFTVTVTNTSVEPVILTSLVDDVYLDLDGQGDCALPQTVGIGDSYTCAFPGAVNGDAFSAHTDTVTATAEDNEGNEDAASADAAVTVNDVPPSVTLDKSADPAELPLPGGDFTYTLTITNTSVEPVTIDDLADDNALSAECLALIGTTLGAGETVSCAYTVTHLGAGVYGNAAAVTVSDNEGNDDSAADSESVMVTNPVIALDKLGPVYAFAGDAITFTYEVSNAGNVPLSNVSVTDDKCGAASYASGDTNNDSKLDLDEVWTFTCTYTPAFTALNTLTNVGVATGEYRDQQTTATDGFTLFPFRLRKKVYLYWNTHTTPYNQPDNTPFTVNMYQGSTLVATFTISQSSPKRIWLSAGAYNFQEVNLPPGYLSGYHHITYTTGQGYPDWTFPNVITFDLAIDKTGPTGAFKGDTVTYNYAVTNAGPASVAPVVSDNKCRPLVYVTGDADNDGLVDPGEVWKYKCNYTVTSEPGTYITNKATVDDVFEPTSRWYLGGDRNMNNNTDTWTFRVQWKGCSRNYWKTNTSLWPSPYTTTTLVTGVFTVPGSYFTSGKLDLNGDGQADNLLKALNYSTSGSTTVKGAARSLLRAAVAALFNEAKYGNLFPPYATKQALISAVNSALATRNVKTMISLANTLNKWNSGTCP